MSDMTVLNVREETKERFLESKPFDSVSQDEWVNELIDRLGEGRTDGGSERDSRASHLYECALCYTQEVDRPYLSPDAEKILEHQDRCHIQIRETEVEVQ